MCDDQPGFPLTMTPSRSLRPESGVLLVEAIMGAFIMVFAFAAATSLFSAALQWESRSASMREASLVAQRKMAELRAWSATDHAANGFSTDWSSQTGISTYPESPGYEIEVTAGPLVYTATPPGASGPPPDGFYSPCSSFYNQPPSNAVNPRINQQLNSTWQTYPYARDLSESYRKVEVIVRYGSGNGRELRLVSVIGDPIAPLHPTNPVRISRVAGAPDALYKSNPTAYSTYQVQVFNDNNQVIPNVPVIWSVVPTSTANAILVPQDPTAQTVRVFPTKSSRVDTEIYLACKIRYGGREAVTEMTTDPLEVRP